MSRALNASWTGNRAARRGVWLALLWLLVPGSGVAAKASTSDPAQRMILGYVERIWLTGEEISVKAKLDTGAKTSSVDARNIQYFKRDGERWVRFDLGTRDSSRPSPRLERPVHRFVRIKRHERDYQRRAVIKLSFCIAGRKLKGEFNLINRERFIYPVLIGRQVLKKIALVDAGETFLGGVACAPGAVS